MICRERQIFAGYQCYFRIIRSRPEPSVDRWVRAQPEANLYLSVITIGEIQKGLALMADGKRRAGLEGWLENDLPLLFEERILPVTQAIVRRWGVFTAQRQRLGRPLGMADGLLAATAFEHDLVLVTRNTKDFSSLAVTLLNPWYVEQ